MRSKVWLFMAIASCFIIGCKKDKTDHSNLADNEIAWKTTWGSEKEETTRSLAIAQDGSVAVIGTSPYQSMFAPGYSSWIVNFDRDGNKRWEKSFITDTTLNDLNSIIVSPDGGYVLAGATGLYASTKGQIIKLNSNGEIEWQEYFVDTVPSYSQKSINSIAATPDGGYIVAGGKQADDPSGLGVDYWIVKLDNIGRQEWDSTFGSSYGVGSNSNSTGASCVAVAPDGGYIVVGSVIIDDGNYAGSYSLGNNDIMILKLNSLGGIEWKKSFGGSEQEKAISVAVTQDGGYIVAGSASSQNGDVKGVRVGAYNYNDAWVLKLDQQGQILWQKTLGGWEDDKASSVAITSDGGYIIAGTTASNSGDVTGNHGYSDCWIVKLDNQGGLKWQKTLGGFNADEGTSVVVSPNGGYILAGTTWSNDGDAIGNRGLSDAFIANVNK